MARKDISDIQVICAYLLSIEEKRERYPHEILHILTCQPIKVCYRAMERACDRHYLDYGTSLKSGWVTEKGLNLIKI